MLTKYSRFFCCSVQTNCWNILLFSTDKLLESFVVQYRQIVGIFCCSVQTNCWNLLLFSTDKLLKYFVVQYRQIVGIFCCSVQTNCWHLKKPMASLSTCQLDDLFGRILIKPCETVQVSSISFFCIVNSTASRISFF